MSYRDLMGIIDSEYEALEGMDEDSLITYLVEGFSADRVTARRALVEYGMIDVED